MNTGWGRGRGGGSTWAVLPRARAGWNTSNVSWVGWNLNTVIVPLSIFKQIIEVEYKETEMEYGEINMEITLQALDKTN